MHYLNTPNSKSTFYRAEAFLFSKSATSHYVLGYYVNYPLSCVCFNLLLSKAENFYLKTQNPLNLCDLCDQC